MGNINIIFNKLFNIIIIYYINIYGNIK
jgi:hypothetical protein